MGFCGVDGGFVVHFRSGDAVRFWLHGDPLLVRLREGIWSLTWRGETVQHERLDQALSRLLGRSSGTLVPLVVRLLREPPESTIE